MEPVFDFRGSRPVGLLIFGHLWAEAMLTSILGGALKNSHVLNLNNLKFAQALKLVVALGHLSPDKYPIYSSLNKMRNEIAHNLDGRVLPEKVLRLMQQMQRFGYFDSQEERVSMEFLGGDKGVEQGLEAILGCLHKELEEIDDSILEPCLGKY